MHINKFTIIFFVFLSAKCHAIGVGDNLYTELHKWKSVHETDCPAMSVWNEEKHLLMLWTNEDKSASNSYFIATPDKKLIGMCIKQGDSNYFLLDINNDSIIDTKSTMFYMPYQFIKSKTHIVPKDTSVLRMLNHFFVSSMQADELEELDHQDVDFFKSFFEDSTLANRHLIYLFSSYQRLITQSNQMHEPTPSELCIPLAQSLADECSLVYKKIPPLACVYVVESLLTEKKFSEQAHKATQLYLKSYPDCIPLLVYDYQLEQNEKAKAEKLSALKKNHAKHWMVEQL